MNTYKINIIYGKENIDDLILKSLFNELTMICKNSKFDVTSSYTYLSLNEGGVN